MAAAAVRQAGGGGRTGGQAREWQDQTLKTHAGLSREPPLAGVAQPGKARACYAVFPARRARGVLTSRVQISPPAYFFKGRFPGARCHGGGNAYTISNMRPTL